MLKIIIYIQDLSDSVLGSYESVMLFTCLFDVEITILECLYVEWYMDISKKILIPLIQLVNLMLFYAQIIFLNNRFLALLFLCLLFI